MKLPEIAIRTSWFAVDRCAICGQEWEPGQTSVPTAYTFESIESGDPPQVVCDHCVQEHYPGDVRRASEDRQRFWRE